MRYLFILLFLIASSLNVALAQEKILDYNSHIIVKPNGELLITETIKVNVEHKQIKRGIYRDFPTTYTLSNGNQHRVGFELISVSRNGRPEPFHTQERSNGIRIYIGKNSEYVAKGEQTYEIFYKTNRQIQFLANRDELYFNAIGHGFVFPIQKASATVTLPAGADILDYMAYTGAVGSQSQQANYTRTFPFEVTIEAAKALNSYEGMTVVVAWNKGIILPPSDTQQMQWFVADHKVSILAAGSFIAILLYFMLAWFFVGRDPKGGAVIPLFTPPHGLSPAACQFILDRKMQPSSFSAALVNMAVKGFLTIKPNGDGYLLTKTGKTPPLFPSEAALNKWLFGTNMEQQEIGGTYSPTIANAKKQLQTVLTKEYAKQNFSNNRGFFFIGLALSICLGILMAILSSRFEVIFFAVFASMFGVILVSSIRNSLRRSRANTGWKILFGIFPMLFPILFIALIGQPFLSDISLNSESIALPLYFLSAGLLLTLFYWLLEAPTVAGRKTLDEIEGFKLYLSVAEKDLLNFNNPPEKTAELFERYLPYAIALGVENEWGEKFTAILATGATANQSNLDWYDSSDSDQISNLAHGLASGLDNAIASSATPPSSSGSGFSGGSSGGGGGGGGGGGW